MGTREQILEKSLELFNRNRSTNVSTNHIAAALGISPGSVYYYFKNKEEIIRELYNQTAIHMDRIFMTPSREITEEAIVDFCHQLAIYTYQYRFFYREMGIILANDPHLQQIYAERARKTMRHMEHVFDAWKKAGIVKKSVTAMDKRWMTENGWMLTQLWVNYADILNCDAPPESVVEEEIWHVYAVFRPYFTAKSNRRILKLLENMHLEAEAPSTGEALD